MVSKDDKACSTSRVLRSLNEVEEGLDKLLVCAQSDDWSAVVAQYPELDQKVRTVCNDLLGYGEENGTSTYPTQVNADPDNPWFARLAAIASNMSALETITQSVNGRVTSTLTHVKTGQSASKAYGTNAHVDSGLDYRTF